MNLVLVGLNHKTAPVAVREKLAFPNTCIVEALHRLVDRSQIEEGLIVSTCNRVEVVAKPLMPHEEAIRHITQFLHTFHDLPEQQVRPHLYVHEDASVVRHLFRVTSSLDSMVVGEAQILGQVKDAYAHAVKAGVAGVLLHRLLERSFSVAKRVRTETGIGAHAVSLGSVAVELARKIFDNLKGKTSLLIGAGEMAELSAKCLFEAGAESLLVANRTLANAQQLATVFRGGGRAMGLDELPERLHEADIVIASTGASAYQIDLAMTRAALERRRYRPMLLIDLSVPRTISPDIAKLDNVFVFDVDDLQNVIAHNVRERQREAARAETIIDTEASQFLTSLRQSDIGPTVAALKQRLTEVCDAEFARQRKHLGALTPEQEVAIRQNLLGAIVNKIMHPMILGLRESVQQTGDADTVDLRRAFDLDTVVLPENKPERLPEPTDIPDDPPVTFSSKRR
jgi:glutamyl-tRNA reductase